MIYISFLGQRFLLKHFLIATLSFVLYVSENAVWLHCVPYFFVLFWKASTFAAVKKQTDNRLFILRTNYHYAGGTSTLYMAEQTLYELSAGDD